MVHGHRGQEHPEQRHRKHFAQRSKSRSPMTCCENRTGDGERQHLLGKTECFRFLAAGRNCHRKGPVRPAATPASDDEGLSPWRISASASGVYQATQGGTENLASRHWERRPMVDRRNAGEHAMGHIRSSLSLWLFVTQVCGRSTRPAMLVLDGLGAFDASPSLRSKAASAGRGGRLATQSR
jgi:hypothetical protein